MLSHPRPGQRVRLHYAARTIANRPHHGKLATVLIASKGRPRNHLVETDDGVKLIVPAGNLVKT